jgi:hypothetical protein
VAVHILKFNQGTTPIKFLVSFHAAITLLCAEESFEKGKAF